MKNVSKLIRQTTGLTVSQFSRKFLGAAYKGFHSRVQKGTLYPAEIICIIAHTNQPIQALFDGANFEDLFILGPGGPSANRAKKLLRDPEMAKRVYKNMGITRVKDPEVEFYISRR